MGEKPVVCPCVHVHAWACVVLMSVLCCVFVSKLVVNSCGLAFAVCSTGGM